MIESSELTVAALDLMVDQSWMHVWMVAHGMIGHTRHHFLFKHFETLLKKYEKCFLVRIIIVWIFYIQRERKKRGKREKELFSAKLARAQAKRERDREVSHIVKRKESDCRVSASARPKSYEKRKKQRSLLFIAEKREGERVFWDFQSCTESFCFLLQKSMET